MDEREEEKREEEKEEEDEREISYTQHAKSLREKTDKKLERLTCFDNL